MGQREIDCKDCESEKRDIETGGRLKVNSCEPLPGQEPVPENERKCLIKWSVNPI